MSFQFWKSSHDYWLDRNKVAACAKHYVGDGGTYDGINENNTIIDYHGLLSIHMPAYDISIIKGVSTVMVSYSSWNGMKMHANHDMVTGFLKNTLHFRVGLQCTAFFVNIFFVIDFTYCSSLLNVVFIQIFRVLLSQIGKELIGSPLHQVQTTLIQCKLELMLVLIWSVPFCYRTHNYF